MAAAAATNFFKPPKKLAELKTALEKAQASLMFGRAWAFVGPDQDAAFPLDALFVPGEGRVIITGRGHEETEMLFRGLVEGFKRQLLPPFKSKYLRVHLSGDGRHFMGTDITVLDLHLHLGSGGDMKKGASLLLSALIALFKAVLAPAATCSRRFMAAVAIGGWDSVSRTITAVELGYPGRFPPKGGAPFFDVLSTLKEMSEELAAEGAKGGIGFFMHTKAATLIREGPLPQGFALERVDDAVVSVLRALGYNVAQVLKNGNVEAQKGTSTAQTGIVPCVLYRRTESVQYHVTPTLHKELLEVINGIDTASLNSRTTTRAGLGGTSVWKSFDSSRDQAKRATYRTSNISIRLLQILNHWANRNKYRLGFLGDTAKSNAPPAPEPLEKMVEAARALYPIELAPLVPFPITLATSEPVKSAEH